MTIKAVGHAGSGGRAAEAYLPLRQCVEVLGAALAPTAVRSLLLECLNGIKCRVRRSPAHDVILLLGVREQCHMKRAPRAHDTAAPAAGVRDVRTQARQAMLLQGSGQQGCWSRHARASPVMTAVKAPSAPCESTPCTSAAMLSGMHCGGESFACVTLSQ